jgi:hypothetical protein
MPDCSGEPVVTTLVCFTLFCTRGCGCIAHPAFPAPSLSGVSSCKTRTHRAARARNRILPPCEPTGRANARPMTVPRRPFRWKMNDLMPVLALSKQSFEPGRAFRPRPGRLIMRTPYRGGYFLLGMALACNVMCHGRSAFREFDSRHVCRARHHRTAALPGVR